MASVTTKSAAPASTASTPSAATAAATVATAATATVATTVAAAVRTWLHLRFCRMGRRARNNKRRLGKAI